MAKFSVQYNLYDVDGNVLYDGDIVIKRWGGGSSDTGRLYRALEYHRLSIGRDGKLKLSGCANFVESEELLKINPETCRQFQKRGLNNPFKDYYA